MDEGFLYLHRLYHACKVKRTKRFGMEEDMEERRMEDRPRNSVHKVYINARKTAVLSGVRDVLSFDAAEVYLETEQGVLLIRGDELHVNRLSLEKGEIDIDGRIDSLAYSEVEETGKKAASFLGRLFQ